MEIGFGAVFNALLAQEKIKMNGKIAWKIFLLIILFAAAGNSAWAENVSREAQKHMNRGMAATEVAKSPADYEVRKLYRRHL